MILSRSILLSSLLLLPLAAVADEVTCESVNRQRAECPMDTGGEVRVVRQLSHTACVEGQTWGLFKHSVWVDGGCSAVFASGGSLPASGQSASSSAASSGGAAPNQVTCESVGGRQAECPMNTRGVVRMVRQLSKSPCTEGVSWGLSKHAVWVSEGCRGVFAVDAGGTAGDGGRGSAGSIASGDAAYQGNDRAPGAAIRACNEFANQGYDGTLVAQNALKPGYWEVILRFEEYRYVCNVSSDGRVSSFDKLN